jgi:hypothetical protein
MTPTKLSRTVVGAALAAVLCALSLSPAAAATGPTITWAGAITEGASYVYGQVPAADTCSAVDELAAAVDCTVTGYETTVGSHVLTATATANEVTTTQTINYTVTAWTLKGFYRPVKMGTGVWNKVKAGSVVPLKFRVYVGETKATDVAVVSGFTSQLVSCTDATPSADPVALTTTKKGFALKYRYGFFTKNWKTAKAAKYTKVVSRETHKGKKTIVKKVKVKVTACYAVTVTTDDGSTLQALFRLR